MKRYHVNRENGKISAASGPAISTRAGLQQYWIDGRLHRSDGPAVETPSGTRVWYWKGVRVPKTAIEAPRSVPPLEVLQHPNAEIRRCWLESYGLEDAMIDLGKDGKAEIIDQKEEGDGKGRLWVIHERDTDGEEMKYVEVVCPSTDRTFFLRVPPNMTDVVEAVAWTFEMTKEEYVLDWEA